MPAHMETYSGDGLTAIGGWPAGDPMKVLVTDARGRPVAGVDVRWAVVSGDGGLSLDGLATDHSTTNERGIARMGYRGAFLTSSSPALRSVVRATSAVGTVDFHTISTWGGSGFPVGPLATYTERGDTYRDVGSGPPGAVLVSAVEVQVFSQVGIEAGQPLAGVGVRLIRSEDAIDGSDPYGDTPSVVRCANATVGAGSGGVVFTDEHGTARCDVRLPMTPGDYRFGVRVGGAVEFTGVRAAVR